MRRATGEGHADLPVGVLLLTKGLGRGGTERLMTGAARLADGGRFRVEVAYLLPHKDAFVPDLRAAGVAVHCLDAARMVGTGWVLRLRRLVRQRDITLVHTHAPVPALAARLALGPDGPKVVHTEHNLWDRYRTPTRWANALTFRRNAAAMAVSAGVAASMRSRVPVEVVVHGIDLSAMQHGPSARALARHRLDLPPDAPVLGTVANFTPKKDHAGLLEAFTKVVAQFPEARLVLVGIGPLEATLRQQVDRLGLAHAVVFTGSRDDVFDLLPGFDLFVLGSRYEGLPISLLEAMASGVAPIATRVGGIPEVVTDGTDGRLVEAGDPDTLATAIVGLLADGEARADLATAARRRAADFDLVHAVRQTEDVYARVLGLPGGRR